MLHSPLNYPKSDKNLIWLVKQAIFFSFLAGLLVIFVPIFVIQLIPIGVQLLWKSFTSFLTKLKPSTTFISTKPNDNIN